MDLKEATLEDLIEELKGRNPNGVLVVTTYLEDENHADEVCYCTWYNCFPHAATGLAYQAINQIQRTKLDHNKAEDE